MNQNSNHKSNEGAGRSRARGASHSASSGHGSRKTGTSARSSHSRSGSARSSYNRRNSHRRSDQGGFGKIAVGGVLLILAITCVVFLMKGMNKIPGVMESESETETTTVPETELVKPVLVDGIDITGMSREEAKAAIMKDIAWDMKVVWENEAYEVTDLMAGKVDALLEEIFAGEPKESYTLDTDGLEDAAKNEAAAAAAKWDVQAKNGSISSYDAATDKFLFTGAENGRAVDQEKLAADIVSVLKKKDFDAQIQAVVNSVEPEFSEAAAREKYKTVATFTTKTTANSKRNTNVNLAAKAIHGTVLQPGEEFSFNEVVGERTEAKGYKGAAAYNNGEVVEEIGGGVCQVSSTLYNAVLKAGLKTTMRRSHTFEPSYVTPGTDATISWGGPDYKFVNNSSAAIGIRASYYDRTMTVSIYAIPILEEGMTYSLKSTKLKDMDLPAPTYEEDPTLEPGVEKIKSSGSTGSYWETRLIKTKNGEVVSSEVDHTVTYKGHAPVILRNSSGTMAATEPTETIIDPNGQPVESTAPGEAPGEPGQPGSAGAEPGLPAPGTGSGGSGAPSGNTGAVPAPGSGSESESPGPQTQPAQQPSQQPSAAPQPTRGAVTDAPGGQQTTVPAPGQAGGPGSSDVPVIAPMPGM